MEDPLRREDVERLPRDLLDHELQDDHVPVAVDRLRSRDRLQRTFGDLLKELLASAELAVERRVRFQSAAMREEHAHGDRGLRRLAVHEGGQVGRHRLIEVEPSLLLEHHRRRRGDDDLRQRGNVVDRARVRLCGAGSVVGKPVAFQVHESPVSTDGEHPAWREPIGERGCHHRVEPCAQRTVHPHRGRRGRHERRRLRHARRAPDRGHDGRGTRRPAGDRNRARRARKKGQG
jgi:hypothetical protein